MAIKYNAGKIQDLLNSSLRYKDSLGLPRKWADNENFRLGIQWGPVTAKTKTFPRPVLNICDPIIVHKVSSLQSDNVKMIFSNEDDDELGKTFTNFADREWERCKMASFNSDILENSATKGVSIGYHYIEPSPDGLVKIQCEEIDIANFHVGNPKENNIQKQPHIIVVQRLSVEDIQEIANRNNINTIVTEDKEVIGQEYMNKNMDIDGIEKANLINFFYRSREDGKIHLIRLCGNVIIEEDLNLNIKKYPFSVFQWTSKTEDFYSKGEIDALKPNQKQLNALMGIMLMNIQIAGYPKLVSKKGSISPNAIKNIPGEHIIDNLDQPGINIQWMQPTPLDATAINIQQILMDTTRQLAGASDIQVGQDNGADNATAIMLMQKSGQGDLSRLKRKYYQYIEDTALIWLEFFCNYYILDRQFSYIDEFGNKKQAVFNAKGVDVDSLGIKIDIGTSSEWSETFTVNSLDNFLKNQYIDFPTYLKYVPENVVPFKNQLLQQIEAQEQAKQQEAMQYIMDSLSPQEKELFDQLPPEGQNRFLLKKANEESALGQMDAGNMNQNSMQKGQMNNASPDSNIRNPIDTASKKLANKYNRL